MADICKYCDTKGEGNLCSNEVFNLDVDFGVFGRCDIVGQMYKASNGTELLNMAFIGGNRSIDFEVKIEYCPMCGRKLKGAEGNV